MRRVSCPLVGISGLFPCGWTQDGPAYRRTRAINAEEALRSSPAGRSCALPTVSLFSLPPLILTTSAGCARRSTQTDALCYVSSAAAAAAIISRPIFVSDRCCLSRPRSFPAGGQVPASFIRSLSGSGRAVGDRIRLQSFITDCPLSIFHSVANSLFTADYRALRDGVWLD
jgi:hypothetical protein